jgi:hypothetical protein
VANELRIYGFLFPVLDSVRGAKAGEPLDALSFAFRAAVSR